MFKLVWYAIATLIGTVVGAGILGIPYVAAQSGFVTALIVILGLGIVMTLVNLCLGEIALRTKGDHQLTGYSTIYLGNAGRFLMTLSMIIGIYGALLAYTIGVGNVLSEIFGYSDFFWGIIFYVFAASIIFGGIEFFEKSEFYLTIFEILVLLFIFYSLFSYKNFNFSNLAVFNISKVFIPFGVVLFAYLGTSAIPSIKEELKGNYKLLKKSLLIGSIIPIIVYILFPLAVIGVTGLKTTPLATVGIARIFGYYAIITFNLFAFFAMASSFVSLGFALKQMYFYDFKVNHLLSWALTSIVPLSLYILGFKDFEKVLGFTGAISGGLAIVIILLMFLKAKQKSQRKPEYNLKLPKWIIYLMIILIIIGSLIEVFGSL